ncbi:alpha/beta fold hydrolase [Cellulomonas sp. P22]|uniref:alpha/beta fold hydrolase n=1 Tax=Cellulomonas sp. P22 TaxID=3373189 RepID=UPI003796C1FD
MATDDGTTAAASHTLDVEGAELHYDVRDGDPGTGAALFIIGSPMEARWFGGLVDRFPTRTVVTYDPRGAARSTRTDPAPESTPEQHADDLHQIIDAVALGPVDLFATSGGAINALALVARYPEDVVTLVAHEPPVTGVLPDREAARAAVDAVRATYAADGFGPGMAQFIGLTMWEGELPDEPLPAPDPQTFGLPTEDDGSRDDVLLMQNLVTSTSYQPDIDALTAAPTRIVIGVGAESEGQLAHRAGVAIAGLLGLEPVVFPSDHVGFLDGSLGMLGDPDGFATTLHDVLGD